MVIKLSDTLKADETELELLGEVELLQFTIGEQSTWKIWPKLAYYFTDRPLCINRKQVVYFCLCFWYNLFNGDTQRAPTHKKEKENTKKEVRDWPTYLLCCCYWTTNDATTGVLNMGAGAKRCINHIVGRISSMFCYLVSLRHKTQGQADNHSWDCLDYTCTTYNYWCFKDCIDRTAQRVITTSIRL